MLLCVNIVLLIAIFATVSTLAALYLGSFKGDKVTVKDFDSLGIEYSQNTIDWTTTLEVLRGVTWYSRITLVSPSDSVVNLYVLLVNDADQLPIEQVTLSNEVFTADEAREFVHEWTVDNALECFVQVDIEESV